LRTTDAQKDSIIDIVSQQFRALLPDTNVVSIKISNDPERFDDYISVCFILDGKTAYAKRHFMLGEEIEDVCKELVERIKAM